MGAAAARSRERVEVGGLLFSSVCVVREPVSFFSLSRALHQLFLSTTQHFCGCSEHLCVASCLSRHPCCWILSNHQGITNLLSQQNVAIFSFPFSAMLFWIESCILWFLIPLCRSPPRLHDSHPQTHS